MRLVLLLLAVIRPLQGKSVDPVNELCMGCLCEASTDCDRNFRCDGQHCGMLRISAPYWRDAGSPAIKAFERCVLDPYCASRTVQGYMARFRKDCNGDKTVDCQDFAQLHYQGAGCEGDPDDGFDDFRAKLNECLADVGS